MSELYELIASEIADFFAGFGGPGEPDIQSGEAQRLLTERVLSVLALRERAEPVYQVQAMDWHDVEKYLYDEALDRGIRCRVLYTAPPAPVVTAETFEEWSRRCEIQLTLCRPEFREVAEITWNACRAAMLAAPPAPVTAGWIACSERMPEVGDEIFYYCEDDGIRDCGIVGSSNFTGRGDPELFVHSEGFDLHLGADITHWMPLPEAPAKN
ncbi:DUF551 domain-containing protein [Cronobacter sakazakii]|nr:DUF551 domain-containing protein [Cronobacter sakazakii]EJX1223272.1 DUF551 domain-containing protein [Cronobacter sakazakii]EJY8350294.1 DUF551 domain-containing protein [Cronobacter sakazakii]EJY8390337.1 DUF551 domain-containing protein [Cronobacter sakazakii]EJY8413964.1 DUF551 domain-containing protein [Cronobacter sakazakii]